MARLERARLEHGGQPVVMLGEHRDHLRERHRAVADGAAHQPVALVGELHAVVLEMHVPNVRRDPPREVERRLGDRKGVAGVEDDADAAGRLLAEARPARGW